MRENFMSPPAHVENRTQGKTCPRPSETNKGFPKVTSPFAYTNAHEKNSQSRAIARRHHNLYHSPAFQQPPISCYTLCNLFKPLVYQLRYTLCGFLFDMNYSRISWRYFWIAWIYYVNLCRSRCHKR